MTPLAKRQLALQTGSALLVLALAWPYYAMRDEVLPWLTVCLAIGGTSALLAWKFRQPWWWCLLHGVFAPAAWWVSGLHIPPLWFLGGFMLLLLLFRGAVTEQVPLYHTSDANTRLLASVLPPTPGLRFLDLGAGWGSVLCGLAQARPEGQFVGIENAPLSWLVGKLRTLPHKNLTWCWGDFWSVDLAPFEVVYVFLSPAPMAELWTKACAEMQPGALFISNSFAVPDVAPSQTLGDPELGERQLYFYRIPESP